MLYDTAEMWDGFVQSLSGRESVDVNREMSIKRTNINAINNQILAEYVMFVHSGGKLVAPVPKAFKNGLILSC